LASEPNSTQTIFQPNSRKGLARFNVIEIAVVLLGLSLWSTGTTGMIIGIPLILGALYSAVFIPPKYNRGLHLGTCPSCGAAMSATHYQNEVDCPSCGAFAKVEPGRFVAMPGRKAG